MQSVITETHHGKAACEQTGLGSLRDIDGFGRCLVATNDILAGDVVYEGTPSASVKVVDLAFSSKVCLHCGNLTCSDSWGNFVDQPLQCHECQAGCWCSLACQQQDAALHSTTCRFIRPLLCVLREKHREFMQNDHAREAVSWSEGTNLRMLLAILCLRAQHLHLEGSLDLNRSFYPTLAAMESNVGRWPMGSRHSELLPLWSQCLQLTLPKGWVPADIELEHLFCASTCNHFSMWLPDYNSYGSVADPGAALMNHSCTPNVCRTANAQYFCLRFVAMRDIKKGEQLQWSYFPSDSSFTERQSTTKEYYCFECVCSRCVKGRQLSEEATIGQGVQEAALVRSFACPCGGWMYPAGDELICSMCMQPAEVDDGSMDYASQEVLEDGSASPAEREEEQDSKENEVVDDDATASELSDKNGDVASIECRCGGWRFKNLGMWLCVYCDREIRDGGATAAAASKTHGLSAASAESQGKGGPEVSTVLQPSTNIAAIVADGDPICLQPVKKRRTLK